MKITQDVRDYAAAFGVAEENTRWRRVSCTKSDEFLHDGAEIYKKV